MSGKEKDSPHETGRRKKIPVIAPDNAACHMGAEKADETDDTQKRDNNGSDERPEKHGKCPAAFDIHAKAPCGIITGVNRIVVPPATGKVTDSW
jgi:hypothetical protein